MGTRSGTVISLAQLRPIPVTIGNSVDRSCFRATPKAIEKWFTECVSAHAQRWGQGHRSEERLGRCREAGGATPADIRPLNTISTYSRCTSGKLSSFWASWGYAVLLSASSQLRLSRSALISLVFSITTLSVAEAQELKFEFTGKLLGYYRLEATGKDPHLKPVEKFLTPDSHFFVAVPRSGNVPTAHWS
jgi:hypothetical protein